MWIKVWNIWAQSQVHSKCSEHFPEIKYVFYLPFSFVQTCDMTHTKCENFIYNVGLYVTLTSLHIHMTFGDFHGHAVEPEFVPVTHIWGWRLSQEPPRVLLWAQPLLPLLHYVSFNQQLKYEDFIKNINKNNPHVPKTNLNTWMSKIHYLKYGTRYRNT